MNTLNISTKNHNFELRTIDNLTESQRKAVIRDAFKIRSGGVLVEAHGPNNTVTLNTLFKLPVKYNGWTFRSIAINPKNIEPEMRVFGPLGSMHKNDGSLLEFEAALDKEQKEIEKAEPVKEEAPKVEPKVKDVNRCTCKTKNGKQCSKNAYKDGLCHVHYRHAQEDKVAEQMAAADEAAANDAMPE